MNTRQVFNLLLIYRWLSLIPAVLSLAVSISLVPAADALLAAASVNLLITLLPNSLNSAVRARPWLLSLDLLLCALLAGLTGGWSTPYYLYAFSPLLAAALFFELKGAWLAASAMAALFVGAGVVSGGPAQNWQQLVAQVVGFFLIAGTFGYASSLLTRLQKSHTELDRVHRDLQVIHELILSLQSAADVTEVEERVLTAVTRDLGYPRAFVALVDQNEGVITSWQGQGRDGQPALGAEQRHVVRLAVTSGSGPLAEALRDNRARLSVKAVPTSDIWVDQHLGAGPYHLFPMVLREHPVGVLLVDASEEDNPGRLRSLEAIASQAAVAVGTTMLCIDRAQRLAVQDERIRFASEIHDTVSQSLFGLAYSLDACVKLLPEQAETVKVELADLRRLAENTRSELRQSILNIWPSELTAEQFARDLRRFATDACRSNPMALSIDVRGDFGRVPAGARRSLYRIAQEALTNIVRHAGASQAQVCLDVSQVEALLAVRDNGQGFEPEMALAREINRERFGLRGIQERAASLGGTCEFVSGPGAGSSVLVSVPLPALPDSRGS